MVLLMVALSGHVQAQETSEQAHEVCAYVQTALPLLIYGYVDMISDPLVIDGRAPPWLLYGGSFTIIRPVLQPEPLVLPMVDEGR